MSVRVCVWGGSCSPVDQVVASAVDTGVAATLVHLCQAGGVVVALRAQAGEAADAVDAGAAVVARVDDTVVDIDVAHGAWKRGATQIFDETSK